MDKLVIERDDCELLVAQQLKTSSFQLIEYSIQQWSDTVEGFLGEHLRLKCNVKLNNDAEQVVNFFIKRNNLVQNPNFNDSIIDALNSTSAFKKEALFYNFIIGDNFLDWVPKYLSYPKNKNLIILSDLSVCGYSPSRIPQFDFAHCCTALKTMAKMHAYSVHFEKVKSIELGRKFILSNEYPDITKEVMFTRDELFGAKWLESAIKFMNAAFEYLPSKYTVEQLRQKLSQAVDNQMKTVLVPSKKYQNVICHGDLWVKNILFQYKEDIPEHCVFVDFQLLRYLPPAHDLLGFIYIHTTREFRRKNLSHLINFYYQAFGKELETYGLDLHDIYPFDKFLSSCYENLLMSKIMAAFFNELNQSNPDYLKEVFKTTTSLDVLFQKEKYLIPQMDTDPVYRNIILESIDELQEILMDPMNIPEYKYLGYTQLISKYI